MTEESAYGFSKDRLPASFSYPLKRSLLDVALYEASVMKTVYSVRYLFGRGSGPSALDVMFQPESGQFHASVSGRCLITVWAVPSEKRKQVEDVIVTQGLPLLCQWLARSTSAGNAWRGIPHSFALIVRNGLLSHEES
jgi:hypothetical protein